MSEDDERAPGATAEELAALERWLGAPLPASVRLLWSESNGRDVPPLMRLYSAAELPELAECSPVWEPGFLAVGASGGSEVIVVPVAGDPSPVYLLDPGCLSTADATPVADDLVAWVRAGCPRPEDPALAEAYAQVDVVLDGVGSAGRLPLISLLRRELGLDMQAARALVDGVPCVIQTTEAFLAERLLEALQDTGADAHVVRRDP
jgi:ribosomal protein L7/L12